MVPIFQIKLDGCVGQSFVRSFAVLTRESDQFDAVHCHIGATKTA